ncbi:FAD-binding oxidoreductase [Rhodobacteraceae bacterium HSP-20]|uniref:FAD-binding oxidoreductase n=1 Tax=Paragemmobacter amnigenus TaxID=2852097 RepID=A0ABS6J299_9RHOB|nr:FAD-dependent oxidoreductase [Rhodobacter amnigenus]MBU9697562.1 FAD-binding oxidoreductase [Rhodobacter amnigenus]MBV4388789.1 FAD-binding oxidoreductase [Rhodobacter amnigenus]
MTRHVTTEIAVIGAGVVGLAVAERLLAQGHAVTLLDPHPPAATVAETAASYGNAGTIADYAVLPVGTPDVLKNLPSLLFDRNSPLAIRRAALPALLPWLARFALQSLPRRAEANARTIAALLSTATADWLDLGDRLGGGDILKKRGCLYVYEKAAAFRAAATDMAFRRSLGVTVDLIDPATLRQMEPALPEVEGGAAFFPQAVFLDDPGRMVALLAAEVTRRAEIIATRADRLDRQVDGVTLTGPGLHLHARRVVIAAGAHSRRLAAMAGDRVPLDTERGYHVEWDMDCPPVTRPTCPTTRGFYLCPMQGRLRVAGTVELGGLTAPPSPHRIARLVEGARAIFPDLPEPSRQWMGFRPSMPDSVPVIGPSRAGAEVIHAYGHGHIGLTLAPVTARLVADIIAGRPTEMDLRPLLPHRF